MTRDKQVRKRDGQSVVRWRHCARRASRLALAMAGVIGLSGCTDWAGYDIDRAWDAIPALSTLRGSVAYDPYEMPRLPAEGTVPVAGPHESVAPFTQAQLDSVGAVLTNPLSATPEVLSAGEETYNQQCSVCHGPAGAGDGSVVGPGKYPFAPAINGTATAARSDGYIYGVIRVGRGLMPSYGERIPHLERWAVVHYVRQLQQQTGAAPSSTAAQ